MIGRVIEILTVLSLLVPFTYLFKAMVNLKTRVTLLEAKIVLLLIIYKTTKFNPVSTAKGLVEACIESL